MGLYVGYIVQCNPSVLTFFLDLRIQGKYSRPNEDRKRISKKDISVLNVSNPELTIYVTHPLASGKCDVLDIGILVFHQVLNLMRLDRIQQ